MPSGKRCTVCDHKSIEAINHALVSGTRPVDLAARYEGISRYSLARHGRNHIPRTLVKAQAAAEVATADSLLGKVAELEQMGRRMAADAEQAGERRTVLVAVRELSRLVELLAKMRGEISEAATVNVIVSPQWLQVRQAVLVALEPYPEARVAVAARLGQLELEGET